MLGVGLALLLVLTGPLLLFNPWFVSFEQARNDVAARLATTQTEVDRVTGGMLGDLFFGAGDFGERLEPAGQPLLTDAERSHMRDVGRLVRTLWLALFAGLVLFIGGLVALRQRRRIGLTLVWTSGAVAAVAVVLGAVFAFAFDRAFLAFHELFFPQGNFLFGPDSNLLRLFPEGFWFESTLVAGLSIVLACLVAALAGWRLARR